MDRMALDNVRVWLFTVHDGIGGQTMIHNSRTKAEAHRRRVRLFPYMRVGKIVPAWVPFPPREKGKR